MAAVHCACVGTAGGGGGNAVRRRNEVAGRVGHRIVDDAVLAREIAVGVIEIGEVEELVLLQRAAEAGAGGVPPFRSLDAVGVAVGRFQRAVAEEPVAGAVRVVAAALGDGVDHAAHGAAELGREAVGEHLEFLHGVLRELAADARAAGVLVVETVGGVVAVGEEGVARRDAAEADQPELAIVGDGGGEQHEAIHAAAVDRQIVDLVRADGGGDAALGVFHQRRFRT